MWRNIILSFTLFRSSSFSLNWSDCGALCTRSTHDASITTEVLFWLQFHSIFFFPPPPSEFFSSFFFELPPYKEPIPSQHICKWPSDVFYNLVNYCFSRQDSRDPEHTWPEGTYLNNCFSCCTQREQGEGGGVEGDGGRGGGKWIGNAVFHLLKCQLKSRLLLLFHSFPRPPSAPPPLVPVSCASLCVLPICPHSH